MKQPQAWLHVTTAALQEKEQQKATATSHAEAATTLVCFKQKVEQSYVNTFSSEKAGIQTVGRVKQNL